MPSFAASSPLAAVSNWSPEYRWIPVAGGFVNFVWSVAVGANDVAISFGTSVGSEALTMLQAVMIAAVLEISGAVFMGNQAVVTSQSSLLSRPPPEVLLMWGLFIALIAASIWLGLGTFWELPVSSSLSMTGAIIGICVAAGGVQSIHWNKPESWLDVGGVLGIIISWIIAPLVAGISSFFLFGATKMTLLRPIGSKLRTLRAMPLYYGVTVMVVMSSILYERSPPARALQTIDSTRGSLIAGISGIVASVVAYLIVVPLASKRLGCFSESPNIEMPQQPPPQLKELKESSMIDGEGCDFRLAIVDSSNSLRKTADGVWTQFIEQHVLDTVYEEDGEGCDQSPISIMRSPACTPITFTQLLKQTPNQLVSFKRLRHVHNITPWQKMILFFENKIKATIHHSIEYEQDTLVRHAMAEKFDNQAEELFSFLLILLSCAASFSHGSNEVTTAMNPYAALLQLYTYHSEEAKQEIPISVLALGGIGVSLGFALWGWKIVRCIGGGITYLSPSRGFSAQLCALATVLLATKVELPVSALHILLGSIIGVGLADSMQNLNWMLLLVFLAAWVATLLVTSATAAGFYAFTIYSPSYVAW
ncbi:unnamed protein product [Sphagnum jensenii]|uniref:Phosphate transporter n=1 Tax=Sphagnum jensenii TaxID=128206 RepID=A0ABP1A7A8_9BRYO